MPPLRAPKTDEFRTGNFGAGDLALAICHLKYLEYRLYFLLEAFTCGSLVTSVPASYLTSSLLKTTSHPNLLICCARHDELWVICDYHILRAQHFLPGSGDVKTAKGHRRQPGTVSGVKSAEGPIRRHCGCPCPASVPQLVSNIS